MANYNAGKIYNRALDDNGAMYNSGPFVIIILDNGVGLEQILNTGHAIVSDSGIGDDDNMLVMIKVDVLETTNANDVIMGVESTVNIADVTTGDDVVNLADVIIAVADAMDAYDSVLAPAATFFSIDADGYLQPLGVFVERDSRYELLAPTRDMTEEIPGAHGELDLGTMLGVRTLELSVVADKDPNCDMAFDKEKLKRLYAKYLDPTKGYKNLVFSNDVNKTYQVKYSGKIDIEEYANWFRFTIPFKMLTPFTIGSFEQSLTGSGTIENEGTFETGLIVEINGPVIDPNITIGVSVLEYIGEIDAHEVLIIDTEKKTVKIGDTNAMVGYNKSFPLLPPGELEVVAPSNVTIKWRHKWI